MNMIGIIVGIVIMLALVMWVTNKNLNKYDLRCPVKNCKNLRIMGQWFCTKHTCYPKGYREE